MRVAKGMGLAAAAMLWNGAATAADTTTIGCVQWRMPAAARTALIADLKRNLRAPKGVTHVYSDAARTGMQSAAATCQNKYGWSDAARVAAIMYTMATIGEPFARDLAVEAGLDYERLAARLGDLSASDLRAGPEGPGLRKMAEAGAAAGEISERTTHRAGAIYGVLLIAASSLAKFTGG